MNRKCLFILLINLAPLCPNIMAQHLWWNLEGQRDATCLYGEITVLATAQGDGIWGELHDAYFLAEGDKTELDRVLAKLPAEYGTPAYGGSGKRLSPIPNLPVPAAVIGVLQNLPHAAPTR
jgi:hypothetical protein